MSESIYPATILKALAQVRAAVPGVPKTGRNDTQHYAYSSESDVLGAYNPAMNEAGLIVLPAVLESRERIVTTAKGGQLCIVRVVMEFRLAHRDGGVWPVGLRWEAEGMDTQDKATAKAITSATKYFLTSLFQAEKGTDPDADTRDASPASPRPSQSPPRPVGASPAGTAVPRAHLTVVEFKRLWRSAVETVSPDAAWDYWLSVRQELQAVCTSMGEWGHICKVVKDGMAQLGLPKDHAAEGLPTWAERHGYPQEKGSPPPPPSDPGSAQPNESAARDKQARMEAGPAQGSAADSPSTTYQALHAKLKLASERLGLEGLQIAWKHDQKHIKGLPAAELTALKKEVGEWKRVLSIPVGG